MKERYNSEKNLKNSFDNYQMPFDNEAFDKFKKELDKEEKRNKFIWWLFNGKIIIPILLVGLAALAIVYLPEIKENENLSSANTIITNSTESPQISSAIPKNTDPTQKETSFANTSGSLNRKGSNEEQENTNINIKGDEHISIEPKLEKSTINNSKKATLKSSPSNNTQVINSYFGNSKMSGQDSIANATYKISPSIDPVVNIDASLHVKESSVVLKPMEKGLLMLDLLMLKSLKSQAAENIIAFNKEVNPYKVKFKKYFYFDVGAGMTIEDNHGPYNSVFAIKKTNEFFWRTTVAYQVSPSTSFELSYMQKNVSIGFHAKGFNYTEKYDKKISLFKINMVNKIWDISPKVNLNMTTGISLIKAPSHINDFPDTKNTSQIGSLPTTISNINSEWKGLYKGTHLLYSSGLNVDVNLSKRLDLNIAAEYTLGNKPIMSADLNYIEGEGLFRKLQAQTNASFASFSLGLKYRLRKD